MRLPRSAASVFPAALLFVGCTPEGVPHEEHDELQEQLRRQKMQVQELEEKLEEAKDEALEESPAEKRFRRQVLDLQNEAKQREEDFEALQKEFDDYKEKYKVSIRSRSLNEEIGTIETESGVYEDVVVKSADPAGVRISYAAGTGRLKFDELDDDLRERFGYDPDEVESFLAAEAEKRETARDRIAAARKRSAEAAAAKTEVGQPGPRSTFNREAAIAEGRRLQEFVTKTQRRCNQIENAIERAEYKDGGSASIARRRQELNELRDKTYKAEARIAELREMLERDAADRRAAANP